MPIAMETLAEPNTAPTTVGIMAKKPPLAAPLIMTKAINGPSVLETGHKASILNALKTKEKSRVLTGPTLSPKSPQQTRPMAEEKLKAATRAAPTCACRPRDLL